MASPDHSPPGAILQRISEYYRVIDYDEASPTVARDATRSVRVSA